MYIFKKTTQITNSTKIRPVASELFHTDGLTDMKKLTAASRNFCERALTKPVQVTAGRTGCTEPSARRDNMKRAERSITVLIKSTQDKTSTLTTILRQTGDANLHVKQRIHFASAHNRLTPRCRVFLDKRTVP